MKLEYKCLFRIMLCGCVVSMLDEKVFALNSKRFWAQNFFLFLYNVYMYKDV